MATWRGKIIGGLIGSLIGGPLGLLFGIFIGHLFDSGTLSSGYSGFGYNVANARKIFFQSLFSIMGHLAKADGHVSPAEINMAEVIMARMRLTSQQRQEAIDLFNQGKNPSFNWFSVLTAFKKVCLVQPGLVQIFIELLVDAAMADGKISHAEQQLLIRISQALGVSTEQLSMLQSMRYGYKSQQQHRQQSNNSYQQQTSFINNANPYQILGTDSSATDAEIKKAYRRQMSQHHPDKLVAKGMPKEMITIAKEKTQAIKAAYDQIKQMRNMR